MHQKKHLARVTIWGLGMYSMLILLLRRDGYCVGADVSPWSLMRACCFGSHFCFVLGLPSHDLDVGNNVAPSSVCSHPPQTIFWILN